MKKFCLSFLVMVMCAVSPADALVLPLATPYITWSTATLGGGIPLVVCSNQKIKKLSVAIKKAMQAAGDNETQAAGMKSLKKQLAYYRMLRAVGAVLIAVGSAFGAGAAVVGAVELRGVIKGHKKYSDEWLPHFNVAPLYCKLGSLNCWSTITRGEIAQREKKAQKKTAKSERKRKLHAAAAEKRKGLPKN